MAELGFSVVAYSEDIVPGLILTGLNEFDIRVDFLRVDIVYGVVEDGATFRVECTWLHSPPSFPYPNNISLGYVSHGGYTTITITDITVALFDVYVYDIGNGYSALDGVTIAYNGTTGITSDGFPFESVIDTPINTDVVPTKSGYIFVAVLPYEWFRTYLPPIVNHYLSSTVAFYGIDTSDELNKSTNPDPQTESDISYLTRYLFWTAPENGANSYNVYFGTDPTFTTNIVDGENTSDTYFDLTSYITLAEATTYYWRVDSVGDYFTIEGTHWSFTTTSAPTYEIIIYENNSLPQTTAGSWRFGLDTDLGIGQTFTPAESHSCAGVSIYFGRLYQNWPGNISVYLKSTADGYPVDILAEGTLQADLLPSNTYESYDVPTTKIYEYVRVLFDTPYQVVSGTTYAITVEPVGGGGGE